MKSVRVDASTVVNVDEIAMWREMPGVPRLEIAIRTTGGVLHFLTGDLAANALLILRPAETGGNSSESPKQPNESPGLD